MTASTKRNRTLHFFNLPALLLIPVLMSLSMCAFGQAESDPWVIIPSGLRGRINECTTHNDLVRTFGASNVTEKDGIEPFSGDMQYVSVVFHRDRQRSIEVLWQDDKKIIPS